MNPTTAGWLGGLFGAPGAAIHGAVTADKGQKLEQFFRSGGRTLGEGMLGRLGGMYAGYGLGSVLKSKVPYAQGIGALLGYLTSGIGASAHGANRAAHNYNKRNEPQGIAGLGSEVKGYLGNLLK